MLIYIFIVFIILCILEYFILQYLDINKKFFFRNDATDAKIKLHLEEQPEIIQLFKVI